MRDNTAPIAIVGGGIGGLALAVALRARGIPRVVYEQAPALDEIGAGLLLTPNAAAVVEALGLTGALAGRHAIPPSWEILSPAGDVLQRLRPFPDGRRGLSLRRSDLQAALADALPDDAVRLGHRATRVALEAGGVRVRWAAGRGGRRPPDLFAPHLVAADGTRSLARRALAPGRGARYSGYVGWRAIVRGVPDGWGGGRVTETWGDGARFGIAEVGGGRTYWYASANAARDAPDPPAGRRARLLARFGSWHAPVAALVEATPERAILRHPIEDARAGWRLVDGGRLALLGDAAHPLTPNLGQGAAMALEDAWELARALGGAPTVASAFGRYARRRRARVAAVWVLSRALGRVIQLEGRRRVALRNRLLAASPDGLGSLVLARLFHYRAR